MLIMKSKYMKPTLNTRETYYVFGCRSLDYIIL